MRGAPRGSKIAPAILSNGESVRAPCSAESADLSPESCRSLGDSRGSFCCHCTRRFSSAKRETRTDQDLDCILFDRGVETDNSPTTRRALLKFDAYVPHAAFAQ